MKSIFLAKSDWWQSIGPFPRLLYSIAVCYNMLHHIAGCCRMLQYIAVCCRMLQDVAVYCSMLQCVAVYCSMLQCIAVCCIYCSMLQYVAVRYSMLQYIAVCYRMLHYIAVCCIALLYCRIFSKYPYYGKFLLVANYYWWQIIGLFLKLQLCARRGLGGDEREKTLGAHWCKQIQDMYIVIFGGLLFF